jgi:hypothetical protein
MSKIKWLLKILHSHKVEDLVELSVFTESGIVYPVPTAIRRKIFKKWGQTPSIWIETGTFRGDSAEFLSQIGTRVITIEPSESLYRDAVDRFRNNERVNVRHGISELELPRILDELSDGELKSLSFWLDGHYSKGITFQGPQDCPLLDELNAIDKYFDKIERISILIDDVRNIDPSNPEYATYPTLSEIVKWSDDHNLYWVIEQDIFIITNNYNYPEY